MKGKPILVWLALAVALGLFYWPTFRWLANTWLSSDYYSHGFLIPPVSAFLVWTKRKRLARREPTAKGAFVLAAGAALYLVGMNIEMRVLGALSLLILIAGLVISFMGIRAFREILFPWFFLIFMIPLPALLDLGYWLQEISVKSSSGLLSLLGLPVVRVGQEIHLDSLAFSVGVGCSGLNTFVALLALATFYAYLLAGPLPRRIVLLALVLPIAIAANTIRIVSIVLIGWHMSMDTAMTFHDYSDPFFFAVALFALLLLSRAMKCRLRELHTAGS